MRYRELKPILKPVRPRERKPTKAALEELAAFGRFHIELKKTKLTLDQFRIALQTGAFQRIVLQGMGACFVVMAELRIAIENKATDGDWVTLATTEGKRDRMFRDPWTPLALLRDMGVLLVEVRMGDWDSARDLNRNRKRPDMAERLKFAHEYAREGLVDGRDAGEQGSERKCVDDKRDI